MIKLTEAATTFFKKTLQRRGKGVGVRFGIKKTGCSGFAYTVEYVDEPNPTDTTLVQDDLHVYVDTPVLDMLDGVTVDYTKKEKQLSSSIQFDNPREKNRCGCGTSFSL